MTTIAGPVTTIFRALGAIVGAALALLCAATVFAGFVTNPRLTDPGQMIGTAILVFGVVAGAWLFKWSAPAATGAIVRSPVHLGRLAFRRTAFLDPIGTGFWTIVTVAILMIPPVAPRVFLALGGFMAYLLVAVVTMIALPRWWYRALVTLAATPIVMFALIFIAEGFQKNAVGEGALAFLGPLMVSWGVIPATGLIRLIVRALKQGRDTAEADRVTAP